MNLGKRISLVLKSIDKKPMWLCDQVEGLEIGTLSALINRDSARSVFALQIAKATGARLEYLLDGELPMFRQAMPLSAGPVQIDDEEAKLLQYYRQSNATGKNQILQIAQGLSTINGTVSVAAKNKA